MAQGSSGRGQPRAAGEALAKHLGAPRPSPDHSDPPSGPTATTSTPASAGDTGGLCPMPATRGAHVPTLWDGALTDRGEGRGPGGRGQAGLGTPRPAGAPECSATRPGTTGGMWHCRVVWAQAPRLAPAAAKVFALAGSPNLGHSLWFPCPSSGQRARRAAAPAPGAGHRHPQGQGAQEPAWEHGAQPFHPEGEPPLLGTRDPTYGFHTYGERQTFPGAPAPVVPSAPTPSWWVWAPLLPPLRLRGAGGPWQPPGDTPAGAGCGAFKAAPAAEPAGRTRLP